MRRSVRSLLFAVLFTLFSFGWASAQDEYGFAVYVNPVYADAYSEEDILADQVYFSIFSEPGDSSDPVSTLEAAASILREGMKNYLTVVKFYIYTNSSGRDNVFAEMRKIYDMATVHTGVPDEGDYLIYNSVGYGYSYAQQANDNPNFSRKFIYTYTPTYMQSYAQESAVTNELQRIYNSLDPDNKSNIEWITAVYNYVINNVEYDYEHLNDETYRLQHSTYAAAINHTAVCQGYASMVYRLLLMHGIDNRIVTSKTHAWNIVKIGNLYYQIDATWGDSPNQSTQKKHFLRGINGLADTTHELEDKYKTDEFTSTWPISPTDYVAVTGFVIKDKSGKNYPASQEVDFVNSGLDLYASVSPSSAIQEAIWTASDPEIVSLTPSSDGMSCHVNFISSGDVVITGAAAGDTGKTDTVSLSIIPNIPAESLTIREGENTAKTSYTVDTVQTPSMTLTASASPAAAAQSFSWTSSNSSGISIKTTNNGAQAVLTFLKVGNYTVTVKTLDGSNLSKTISFTLNANLSISISGSDKVYSGDSSSYTAAISPEPGTAPAITWSISPGSAGTISGGTFTAAETNQKVTAKITASATVNGKKVTATKSISILPLAENIYILDQTGTAITSARINVGEKYSFSASVLPADADQEVDWSVSNTSILSVTQAGVVTAQKTGSAYLIATAKDGSEVINYVLITAAAPVTSVTIKGPNGEESMDALPGDSIALQATVLPSAATNKKLTWTVSGSATVSSSGVVKINSSVTTKRTVKVTATAADGNGAKGTFTITVYPKPTKVHIFDNTGTEITGTTISVDMSSRSSIALSAATDPADASNQVNWSINNTDIASISSAGLLKFTKSGSVTVTAAAQMNTAITADFTANVYIKYTALTLQASHDFVMNDGGETIVTFKKITPSSLTYQDFDWTVQENGKTAAKTTLTVSSDGVHVKSTAAAGTTLKISVTPKYYSASAKSISLPVVDPVRSITFGPEVTDTFNSNKQTVYQLTATVSPSTAVQTIIWNCTPESVATVDQNGVLTLHKSGTATITASSAEGAAKTTVSVSKTFTVQSSVEKITVNAPDTIYPGKTAAITASVTPSTADNQALSWSVTVDGARSSLVTLVQGKLTVNKRLPGGSTIRVTATARDGTGVQGYADIYVIPLATSIQLLDRAGNPMGQTATVRLNDTNTIQLSAKVLPADATQTVNWKSSSSAVATVSSGLVTFKKAGTVTITASAVDGSGTSASVKITAKTFVTRIQLSGPDTITAGKTGVVTATATPSNAGSTAVTWALTFNGGSTSLATITSGKISVNSQMPAGTLTVTATAADGSGVKASKNITVIPLVQTISLSTSDGESIVSGSTIDINVSQISRKELIASTAPSQANKNVTWKSSNTKIASVSDSGAVTFTGTTLGTVTITATAADGSGKSSTCKFNVYRPVTGINLNGSNTVAVGLSETITAVVDPSNAGNKNIRWTVLANGQTTRYASISQGVLTVNSRMPIGTVLTVTAAAADGYGSSAQHTLTVLPATTSIEITAGGEAVGAAYNYALNSSNTLQLGANAYPSGSLQEFTWKSSAPKTATVDDKGLVTFLKDGVVNITATAKDGTGQSAAVRLTGRTVVTKITLSGPGSIAPGASGTVTASIQPGNAGSQTVSWSVQLDGKSSKLVTISGGTLTVSPDTPSGSVITVTAKSTYAFEPVTGSMTITVR